MIPADQVYQFRKMRGGLNGKGRTSEIEQEELRVAEYGQRGRGQEPEGEAVEERVSRLSM